MIELAGEIFHDPVGRWILYAGIFLFAVASGLSLFTVIRNRLTAMGEDLGIVREQVTNNHTTNLREEADERHNENGSKLDLLVDMVRGQGQSIVSLQRGQGAMYELIAGLQDSDTKTRAEINRIKLEKPNDPVS